MKKTYLLLLLFIAFTIHINAQRKIDLSIRVTRVLPGDTIQPYQTFRFDATTGYYFVFTVENIGPDSLVTGDTIFFKTSWSNTNFYFPVYPSLRKGDVAQMSLDTGQGYLYSNSGYIKFLPRPGASYKQLDTVIWCNTTWLVTPSGNPAIDPDLSNNYRCSPPVVTESIPINVKEVQPFSEFKLYPNPAFDKLHCVFSGSQSKISYILLRNSIGGEVCRDVLMGASGKQQCDIDVSNLSRGLYIVELHIGEQVVTKQIILQ